MRITIGVLTIRGDFELGENENIVTNAAVRALGQVGYEGVITRATSNDRKSLSDSLVSLCEDCDVVFTAGGSGFALSDHAPEVTAELIERQAYGLMELIRINLHRRSETSYLHRGIAGIRGRTVIINLPGSAEQIKESIDTVALLLRPMMSSLSAAPSD